MNLFWKILVDFSNQDTNIWVVTVVQPVRMDSRGDVGIMAPVDQTAVTN